MKASCAGIVWCAAFVVVLGSSAAFAQKSGAVAIVPGTRFAFSATKPKHVTADVEFRDPTGTYWPSFAYGRPADGGTYVADTEKPTAAYRLVCDRQAQSSGDQSRRVLGAFFEAGQPPLTTFEVQSLGPVEQVEREEKDRSGKPQTRIVEFCRAEALLRIGATTIPVQGELHWKYPHGPDKTLYLQVRCEVPRATLRLGKGEGPIRVTASVDVAPAPGP